jgi:hypothetical protein
MVKSYAAIACASRMEEGGHSPVTQSDQAKLTPTYGSPTRMIRERGVDRRLMCLNWTCNPRLERILGLMSKGWLASMFRSASRN